jgi:predicted dehydrogenase
MKHPARLPRRSFLKLLAAGTAAAHLPSIVRAQTLGLGGTAPSELITVGCIGFGGQGNGLLGNFLGNAACRVVAVCDVDATRLDKARQRVDDHHRAPGTCAAYGDYRELLAHPDLDAVVIATPDHWHALMTVHAARAGKHVYCEKPAATSITEGRAMADAVRRAGVVCQIGSMQRSWGEFQRVVELARNGFLGEIKKITVGLPSGPGARPVPPDVLAKGETPPPTLDYDRWLGPAPAVPYHADRVHYQWRWQFAYGGGQVADWIGHHYDIAALAADVAHLQPVAIRAASARFEDRGAFIETATGYSFQAVYANGTVIDTASSHPGGARIEGTEGWVYANRGVLEHSSEKLRRLVIPAHGYTLSTGPRSHTDDFLAAIATRATPRCPMIEGHNVAAVAHLANAAFRAGVAEIRWDPATESLVDCPEAARFLPRAYRAPHALPV